jgi:hypothetical protein
MMAKRGTFLVPTVYPRRLLREGDRLRAQDKNDEYIKNGRAQFLHMIARAHRAGVKVVVGLDLGAGIAEPAVYAREFAVFVEAASRRWTPSRREPAWPRSCSAGRIVSVRSSRASWPTSSRCPAIRLPTSPRWSACRW